MRYYFAVLIALFSSPVFSFETQIECEITSSISWDVKEGLKEYDIKNEKPVLVTVDKQLIALVYDSDFAQIFKLEAVDTFGPFKIGDKPEIVGARYTSITDYITQFRKIIYYDPMCRRGDKGELVSTYSSKNSTFHTVHRCSCLDSVDVDYFIQN